MPTNIITAQSEQISSTIFDQLFQLVEEFVQKQERELPKHPNQTLRIL